MGVGRHSELAIHDQHCIAVTEETVVLANGFTVGAKIGLATRERADKKEQTTAGKMKIGEERGDVPEDVPRLDEEIGVAAVRRPTQLGSSTVPPAAKASLIASRFLTCW